MVGGATAMAVGDPDDVVRPNGARPGDRVLLTKGPAVEATGLLSNQFEDLMDLQEKTVEDAKRPILRHESGRGRSESRRKRATCRPCTTRRRAACTAR